MAQSNIDWRKKIRPTWLCTTWGNNEARSPRVDVRIDRGAASRAVEWGEMTAHVSEINEAVNAPEQMVRRDMVFYRELVEQRALRNLPRPHHRQFSHASGELNQHQ